MGPFRPVRDQYGDSVEPRSALLDLVEHLRAASIAQDAARLVALYAEDAVHGFPFTTPDGPTRLEDRAAIAEFVSTVHRSLPLRCTAYRTIAVHRVSATTIVVEQEALGLNTTTGGAPFALPNVAVIEVDGEGLIASFRDYVNPVAVAGVLRSTPVP